jgi:hypothetical protein
MRFRQRTSDITFVEPGAEAYAFTFRVAAARAT